MSIKKINTKTKEAKKRPAKNIKISALILKKECQPLPSQLHSFYQPGS